MPTPEERAQQLRRDYHSVFNTEAGTRVLDDLKAVCYFNTTTIDAMPHVMSFNEGSRSVVLHIQTRLKLTEEKIKELDRGQN